MLTSLGQVSVPSCARRGVAPHAIGGLALLRPTFAPVSPAPSSRSEEGMLIWRAEGGMSAAISTGRCPALGQRSVTCFTHEPMPRHGQGEALFASCAYVYAGSAVNAPLLKLLAAQLGLDLQPAYSVHVGKVRPVAGRADLIPLWEKRARALQIMIGAAPG